MSDRLCVVMPVYNEQDAIGAVLGKWAKALDALELDYTIRPYNDGSKDNSLAVMKETAADLPRVEVRDKPNGGHGNTILTGYRDAAKDGFDWVFQIDSDDEMGPEKFNELWSRRNDHDFLVGIRDGRVQALPRKIISFVSRLCVRIFYGKSVWDVNTPYRLMRVSAFCDFYTKIPLTTFAPNVILSGLAARHKLRCFEMRVPQHDRTTGEVSIKKWKLLKAAAKSFWQTIVYSFLSARPRDWVRLVFWSLAWGFATISVIVGVKNGWKEFDFQWDPAKLLMMGDNPYVYSLEHKPITYDGFMEQYIDANQVPSCLLLLAPWTLFPQLLANQIWVICNLVFTTVFLIYLWKSFFAETDSKGVFYLVPLLLVTSTPLRVLIGNGQHLMFSLAFFMPAYYYARKGRLTISGVLLALSAFKYTTIAPLALIFVARCWWKPIIIAAAIHIAGTVGCAFYLHESPFVLICQSLQVGAALTGGGISDIASLVASFGGSNLHAWANIGYVFWVIVLFVTLFMKIDDDLVYLSFLAVVSNVMFYHRIYDFVTLVFPLVLVLTRFNNDRSQSSKFIHIALWVNLIWLFYGVRIVAFYGADCIPFSFILEHMLVLALLTIPSFKLRYFYSNSIAHNS